MALEIVGSNPSTHPINLAPIAQRTEHRSSAGQMRSKVKWLLIISLVALLVVPSLGCGFLQALTTPPALNSVLAAAVIQISGVPYIDQYYKEAVGEEAAQASGDIGLVTATGEWVANYQGKGKWVIRGSVITKSGGECLTTWTLSEADSEIHLIRFDCD